MEEATKQPNKLNPMIIVFIIVAVIGVIIFGNKNKTNVKNETSKIEKQQVTVVPTIQSISAPKSANANIYDVKTINIEAGAFYFSQKEIRLKKGEKVKIELIGKDMMHDFRIDELNVKSEIVKAGETTSFEFIADKVGEFEYYCSIGLHRANGQVGKLIVE